ncbi:hypothetical protein ACQ4PT_010130 [Festuca glaucescens]
MPDSTCRIPGGVVGKIRLVTLVRPLPTHSHSLLPPRRSMEKVVSFLSSLLGGGGHVPAGAPAATVASILIYPIKSCRGLSVPQAPVTSFGAVVFLGLGVLRSSDLRLMAAAVVAACRVQVGSAVAGGERQREALHAEGGAQDGTRRGGAPAGGLRRGLAASARLLLGHKSTRDGHIKGPSFRGTSYA